MNQLANQTGTSPHHMDPTGANNYYSMHSLAQQQQQAQYPTGGYQQQPQHADPSQAPLNYQSQFMTDSSQFGQGLNPVLMGQQRPQINQPNPNGSGTASAGYPNYLIMPSN